MFAPGSFSLGSWWSHNQTIGGGERGDRGPGPRLQALGGASPVLPGLGDVRVSTRRRAKARACWPPPLPRIGLLRPGSGSGADPSRSPAQGQPGPAPIRFRTLQLKIGEHLTFAKNTDPARAGTMKAGRRCGISGARTDIPPQTGGPTGELRGGECGAPGAVGITGGAAAGGKPHGAQGGGESRTRA